MALQTQIIDRVFKYGAMTLEDPGIQYSPDQVKDFYANTYAELNNAAVEGPDEKDGKNLYTFRRAVGTKGVAQQRVFCETLTEGAAMIAAERSRQIHTEGYDVAHDDGHTDHSLALAACGYAAPVQLFRRVRRIDQGGERYADCWPGSWDDRDDKRKYIGTRPARADEQASTLRIRCLVKAGALIAAEIDRLLRSQKGK